MFQVFQPLLMEYFTFEELKEIKARVLHLHSVFSEVCRVLPSKNFFSLEHFVSHVLTQDCRTGLEIATDTVAFAT